MKSDLPPATPASRQAPLTSASVWEIYFPKSGERAHATVYLASFPQILYFWPSVVACFAAAAIQIMYGVELTSVAWMFLAVLLFNFVVLAHDFDQKQFVIFVLALVVLGLLTWVASLYGFTAIRSIANWIFSFRPAMSTDTYLLFGSAMLLLFAWGLITPLFSYWKLEQNEFIHYSQPTGRDMSISRSQCSVYREVPDVFEYLLFFGGGSLVVRRGDQVLATIPHIPFLSFRMLAIEHLLAETRVVVERDKI
jgi:hypothetical protein